MLSFAVAVGGIFLVPTLLVMFQRLLRATGLRGPLAPWWYFSDWVWMLGAVLTAAAASAVLLYFASVNHRSAVTR